MGGDGGPMSFLGKKSWHVGSLRMQERVWKKEEEAEKEKKRIEEMRRQIEEEREKDSLLRHERGKQTRQQERLEFMYATPMVVDEKKVEEEYALGKPLEVLREDKKERSSASNVPGSLFVEESNKNPNELWQQMTHDPLVAIKQQEEQALRRIRDNPMKMDAIRTQVRRMEEEKRKRRHRKHVHDETRRSVRSRTRYHSFSPTRDVSDEHGKDPTRVGSDSPREGSKPHRRSRDTYARHNDRSRGRDRRDVSHRRRISRSRSHTPERTSYRDEAFERRSRSERDSHDVPTREERSLDTRSRSTEGYGLQVPRGSRTIRTAQETSPTRMWSSDPRDSHARERKRSRIESNVTKGTLSTEARARKLKEMSEDAQRHEERRRDRLERTKQKDSTDVISFEDGKDPSFLRDVARSLYAPRIQEKEVE